MSSVMSARAARADEHRYFLEAALIATDAAANALVGTALWTGIVHALTA